MLFGDAELRKSVNMKRRRLKDGEKAVMMKMTWSMTTEMEDCVRMNKIATNRLQKELMEWQVNPPTGFKHKVTDNLQRWVIEVNGAPGTLYSSDDEDDVEHDDGDGSTRDAIETA